MCCKLRIHVIVISIISLIITGLADWGLISTYILYNNLTLTYVLCLYWLVSGIMCLAGAIENKRFLLIPFMIGMCLIILICIPWLILTIYYWVLGRSLEGMTPNLTALLFLIYIVILLGPSIYFLGIVVKFYKELASETVAGQGDGCNSTALCFPDRVPTFNGLCITWCVNTNSSQINLYNTMEKRQPKRFSDKPGKRQLVKPVWYENLA